MLAANAVALSRLLKPASVRVIAAVPLLTALLLFAGPATAEPVVDRALSGAQILNRNGCSVLKVSFNFRIQYASHFPLVQGDELRISVRAIDRAQAAALALLQREAIRAPVSRFAAIKAIDFELNPAGGPILRIQFDRPVAYQVAQGHDFESIIVAISGPTPSPSCKPDYPRESEAWSTTVTVPAAPAATPRNKERGAGKISDPDLRAAAASMDEARAALRKGNFAGAIALLAKVLKYPENEHSAEAQELIGVARQKSGQADAARSEYEDYLRRYTSGEGHDRVKQRLAGIVTSTGDEKEKLRGSKSQQGGIAGLGGSTWSMSGSVSQFYIRNDSFRTVRDPSLPPILTSDPDAHRVHQNSLLSSFDLIAAWSNAEMKSKFRFSGTEEHSFNGDKEIVGIAALYGETTIKPWDLTARLGRQTRSSGGVQGRFDGALVSWQGTPWARVNVVGGSPVVSRKDTPFKDDKYFYGASVDFGPFWGGFETSLFAIEQRDRALLDRQAIGAEFRYFDPTKSAFATIDYDVHFNQLNAAIFSGSWTLADKSTINGGLDYRKAPYLSAWTALQGQPFLTLYDMLKLRTKEEIDQLAIDRTATYKSATAGYTRPLTENLQVSVDATVTNVEGTIASGGVDGIPGSGNEYYYSAQLIGTSIFRPGDMYIAGLRFADRADSNLYVLDLNSRFPLTEAFRISPRLRLGYTVGDTTDLREISVLPSVLMNYYWTKDFSFELELGTKWTSRDQGGVNERTTDLFVTAGFRYDFYADDLTKCKPVSINCR
jgi:tetratricopeptide (TPR) repeat protein